MITFPKSLEHGSGALMTLDPSHALVALKEDTDTDLVEPLLKRANAALERAPEPKTRRRSAGGEVPRQRVNHTPRHLWVRIRTEAALAALERSLENRLAWLGPVYRLEGTSGLDGLVCPLPNVLVVRPAPTTRTTSADSFAEAMKRYRLREVPEKSRYLNGLRYFEVEDPRRQSSYEIRDAILQREKDLVRDVRFENMPMLEDSALVPNDPLYGQQWNIAQIQAPLGWDYATGTATIVVAILDDGVETGHPDLDCLPGINLSTMMPTGDPGGSHGTACAGIAAARLNNRGS